MYYSAMTFSRILHLHEIIRRDTIKKQTKQMFIEDEGGSICEGKYADFLIVDKDLLSCPEDVIHTAKPLATYFEGKKVFSA